MQNIFGIKVNWLDDFFPNSRWRLPRHGEITVIEQYSKGGLQYLTVSGDFDSSCEIASARFFNLGFQFAECLYMDDQTWYYEISRDGDVITRTSMYADFSDIIKIAIETPTHTVQRVYCNRREEIDFTPYGELYSACLESVYSKFPVAMKDIVTANARFQAGNILAIPTKKDRDVLYLDYHEATMARLTNSREYHYIGKK